MIARMVLMKDELTIVVASAERGLPGAVEYSR